MTTNPATRPFLVVVGSGIDVKEKFGNRELEVFTMKKIITVTLCIVLVLLFAGCEKNGDTSKVEIDYGASSVYSKEEIDSAIEIIKKQFASFEGCKLHSLSYMSDEECNNADNIEWMNDLRTDDNKEAPKQKQKADGLTSLLPTVRQNSRE